MFTKIGRFGAYAMVYLGLAAIAGSFFFPFDITSPDYRSSFNFRQSTTLFSQGAISVFLGSALGVLCEINEKLDAFFSSDKANDDSN